MSSLPATETPRPGWITLFYKEVLRFWKVAFQTIAAPILTSLLYLLIFSHVLEGRVSVYDGRVSYTSFLVPGLVMMSVLQNAFANSSSSIIQSKVTGNMIFMLLPPLSPQGIFAAYVIGAMVRGLVVGFGVFLVTLYFAPAGYLANASHALWAVAFVLLLPFYSQLRDAGRLWWLWTCVAGFGLGLVGWDHVRRRRNARKAAQ